MAGTRAKIRGRRQSGNHGRKLICCAVATAVVFALAIVFGPDRDKGTLGTGGSPEPIDFSSLAATVIPLDEFGASGNNPAVIASSSSAISTTSGMKSNFMQMTSVSDLVSRNKDKLQRHLESGLRNIPETERNVGEPALLAASWRPTGRLAPEARIVSRELAERAGR
jgi:hypothetical protein